MTGSSLVVVGTDATMVYDAVRVAVAGELGELDATAALEDFTVRDASTGESLAGRLLDALYTPALLVARRVVVVRDAQHLTADEVSSVIAWMGDPIPSTVLILAVVGAKSNKLVKAAQAVIDVNVSSKPVDRVSFTVAKFVEHGVGVDAALAKRVVERIGDDVARVDALARTLHAIYGTAPLTFAQLEPYLGGAGDVPEWDLTDALDAGEVVGAITVARRMLDSRGRAGLQVVNILQRYYLRLARLEGAGVRDADEAATLLGMNRFPAGKALAAARRLGAARLAEAVHLVTRADLDLKGGIDYGSRDDASDVDVTDLTVVEVLVARLARLSASARR